MNETISSPIESQRDSATVRNSLVGAVVSIVLAFLPFSPALGGAVAGYLESADRRAGLRVGAYAGLITAVPFAILVFLAASIFAIVPITPGGDGGVGVFLLVVVLGVLVVTLAYTVGLSTLGGYLGASLRAERERRH